MKIKCLLACTVFTVTGIDTPTPLRQDETLDGLFYVDSHDQVIQLLAEMRRVADKFKAGI